MFLIRKLIVLLMMVAPMAVAAQVDHAIEDWVEESGSEADASELSDLLMHYRDNPANLNDTASLSALPFLSPFQISALHNYIILHGQLLSVKELLMVPGFDSLVVARIAPLVKTEPYEERGMSSLGEILRRGSHTMVAGMGGTFEQAEGYGNGHYEGDNLRTLMSYRFNFGNRVMLRLSADKDPMESWGRDNFYGYSLMVKDIGRLEKLVVGRYNVQFGQGVVLWTGFVPFSVVGSSPVRYAGGIKAANDFYEEGWQQGMAATVRVGCGMSVSAFGSRTDGEWMGGGHLTYRRGNLILGFTAAASLLDDSVQLRNYAYNRDYFRGDRAGVLGFDALWQAGRTLLFGEVAMDHEGHPAAVGGVRLSVGGNNSVGLAVRHFHQRYHALHAAAYGLGGTRNEQGVSFDAQLQLPFKMVALLSADVHRFPSLRYGSYAPSAGSWLRAQVSRHFGQHLEAVVRYALRGQQRNAPGSDSIVYLSEETAKHQLQGQLRYSAGPWRLTTRAIVSWFDTEASGSQHGWLVAQEARYVQGRWQGAMQVAWHDIDGYYARITLSESMLQYAFSIPTLLGSGLRLSALVRCDISRWLNVSFKYTLTARPDEEEIGSGDAATPGPVRQTWHIQTRWKF